MTTPPSGGPASSPDEGESRPGWIRRALPGTCIAAGALCCRGRGVTAESSAHAALTRPPTAAERSAAAAAEVAGRWRAWPAGRIFPARLRYNTALRTTETARAVGLSPGPGCAASVPAAAGGRELLAGCRAALRATYADQLQGVT